MSGLGNKTAISLLQEYMVAQKKIPCYELVSQRVGTHNPEFIFKVIVGNQYEIGIGGSKKEAKHRAAERMLIKLKVIKEKEDGEILKEDKAESNAKSNENYVGQLKNLCISQRYPEPKFDLEEGAGPAHDRVFKVKCFVSQLEDFGIGKTIKQAKHNAAFNMLKQLEEVGGDKILKALTQIENSIKSNISDEEITSKYNVLKTANATSVVNQNVFYKDHHKAFECLPESSSTLSDVIKNNMFCNIDSAINIMEKIANELEVNLETTDDGCEQNFVVMCLFVFPPIAGIGSSRAEAALNLLKSLLLLARDHVLLCS